MTTDVGVTLFIFLAVYLFWEYVNSTHMEPFLVGTGISTGMALVSKYSALLLIPIIALIVACFILLKGSKPDVSLPWK